MVRSIDDAAISDTKTGISACYDTRSLKNTHTHTQTHSHTHTHTHTYTHTHTHTNTHTHTHTHTQSVRRKGVHFGFCFIAVV